MKTIQYLSEDVLKKYCGRKKEGIIALLINVDDGKVYPVPKNLEHVNFTALLLGKTKKELEKNPKLAAHLIPSTIYMENRKIKGVLTGVSGLELGLKVRHNKADLKKAHDMAWGCILLSEEVGTIEIGKLKINKIKIF